MGNKSRTHPDVLTIIVHGTFAEGERWWRFGTSSDDTFADRLEAALSAKGMSGTVWRPATQHGFSYDDFSWSGANRHRARKQGAKKVASSLRRVAETIGSTAESPLKVNFVAHSHGGNVVLEAIRDLGAHVRVGRIALLGTPLITARPSFRLGQIILATILLSLIFMLSLFFIVQIVTLSITGGFLEPDSSSAAGQSVDQSISTAFTFYLAIPILLAYGWIFWAIGTLVDIVWRIVAAVFRPLAWLRGRSSSLVYGPSPRRFKEILGDDPALLVTTRNDEADLILQVTSAPGKLYREYVASEFSKIGRVLELVFLRPFILGVFLKVGEMLLEVFSFGVSAWKSLFVDVEVAPAGARPYYPQDLLIRKEIDVSRRLIPATLSRSRDDSESAATFSAAEPQIELHLSLKEIATEIKNQIKFRHSMYYDNPAVVDLVSDFLAGEGIDDSSEPSRPGSHFPAQSLT